MNLRLFLFVFICFTGMPLMSFAQEKAEGAAAEASKDELAKAQTKALRSQIKDTMGRLALDEAQHFSIMSSNYMIYSMVKAVREDVSGAADQCAQNNPEMASAVRERYAAWEKSVGGTLEQANSNINNMALAQTYMSQNELKTMFGLMDETRRANSSRFETTPVTTPEACEFMMSKMDETEESMNHMLQATLVSYPTILRKNQK